MVGVILCGGVGSRLWPVSRELHPKPFLRLHDGQSFLQKAFLRGAALPGVRGMMSVTNRDLVFKVAEEFSDAEIPLNLLNIIEPFGRNTAPAIAAAALAAQSIYGDDVCLLILPADHLILKQDEFVNATVKARELALAGNLVLFGIKPDRPETGFGYIEIADDGSVVRFVEKPNREAAKSYVASGKHLWNSGMFCFKASTILSELSIHAPELLNAMEGCCSNSRRTIQEGDRAFDCLNLDADSFSKAPEVSIDIAVMERSDRIAVVPCDIGWSDVGTWPALAAIGESDSNGNHITGNHNVLLQDTKNSDVFSDRRLIAALGVTNLLIVDTDDAILVADKNRSHDVKDIYNQLKLDAHRAHKHHSMVSCPWGSFSNLESGPLFKVKRLNIKPGASISLQMHKHRTEHWIVVSGSGEVTCDDKIFTLNANESTFIKSGARHRMVNNGEVELIIIEVQFGSYLEEDDVYRFEDKYGRYQNQSGQVISVSKNPNSIN